MKKNKTTPKRRVPTITFQPDDDVLQELAPILKKAKEIKGYKTRWLNETLRSFAKKAAEIVDAQDAAAEAAVIAARNQAKGESRR